MYFIFKTGYLFDIIKISLIQESVFYTKIDIIFNLVQDDTLEIKKIMVFKINPTFNVILQLQLFFYFFLLEKVIILWIILIKNSWSLYFAQTTL